MAAQHEMPVVAALHDVSRVVNGEPIISDISMRFYQGEMAIITGESGAGKSTVGRLLTAIETPDAGTVELFGRNLAELSQRELDALKSRQVGVGFQTPNLDTNLTVRDNLIGLMEATGRDVDLGFAARTMVRLGLGDSLDKKASKLSGGEKQRLAMARLLVPKPELLILDEPTAPLDPASRVAFLTHIATACATEGISAIIISHDEVARQIAQREFAMSNGHLIRETILRHAAEA